MHNVLLVTKGHPFDKAAFFGIFDDMEGVEYTHVEQPAAQALFNPEEAHAYDAFVFYDMPGIRFHPDRAPDFAEPGERFKRHFTQLLDEGKGMVFLHHAIAGWPAWPEYAETLGGRFLYLPGRLRGVERQDSGYRHGVTHRIETIDTHPVTEGVPESFEITDELYLFEVFEEDVTPILRSNYAFDAANFYSAKRAVADQKLYDNDGWSHPGGSALIGWTREVGASRIVYLQCGDDPVAYGNEHFQRLIRNAINWVSDR